MFLKSLKPVGVTKPGHPPLHLCTPCNPEVCPASSSSERTAGSGGPFTSEHEEREGKKKKVRHEPKLPPGGAQQQVLTLCEGKSACCPKGKVSHWPQWDAPPSRKAPVPPLTKRRGTLKCNTCFDISEILFSIHFTTEHVSPLNRYGWLTHFLRFIKMFSSRFLLPCSFPKTAENRDSWEWVYRDLRRQKNNNNSILQKFTLVHHELNRLYCQAYCIYQPLAYCRYMGICVRVGWWIRHFSIIHKLSPFFH